LKPLRVLIVDDQKLLTDSLKRVLASEKDIETVRLAANAEEAIAEVQRNSYDVILMDIHLPKQNGIEATRIIHQNFPETKILMLTAFGYDEWVKAAMQNGAVGYLLKDISSDELLSAIRAACNGMRIVSPRLLDVISRPTSSDTKTESVPAWFRQLSNRERDVLVLIMRGYSNEEIAAQIHLSTQTVKNYLSTVYEKLGVRNRFQAMRLAMECKIDGLWIVNI
jgi:DNA-binding NarL/FixJ family response regulator